MDEEREAYLEDMAREDGPFGRINSGYEEYLELLWEEEQNAQRGA